MGVVLGWVGIPLTATQATATAFTPQPWSQVLPQLYINHFARHIRDSLYEQGLWRDGNVVGVAKVGRKVSLVKTKPGTSRCGEGWVYFTVTGNNWDWCGTGPFFLALLIGCAFSGYKNLSKWDKEAAGLEVGRSADFSTPASKGEMVLLLMLLTSMLQNACR